MKKLILSLVILVMTSSVLAINLITSNSIFYNITVEQGYVGPVLYNISQMNNLSFEWLLQPEVSWSTHDNLTYLLETSTDGIGGAFFTGLTDGYITNGTWHKYKLQINVPLSTPVGIYPFEIDGTACAPNSGGGIGICLAGGAGKNVIVIPTTKVCAENWECDEWGICSSSGTQTRTCSDLSNCGTVNTKPIESQQCTPCVEAWSCSSWGVCNIAGNQTRTCIDLNSCGTANIKPAETQRCTPCTESWSCGSWTSCINWTKTRYCYDRKKCSTVFNKPITSQSCTCKPSWTCSSWGTCTNGWQTRTCTDKYKCGVLTGRPSLQRSCGGGITVR